MGLYDGFKQRLGFEAHIGARVKVSTNFTIKKGRIRFKHWKERKPTRQSKN
jgi:hypothetical protein